MNAVLFIVSFIIVYLSGIWVGILYHKSVIRNKKSIGLLVIEEFEDHPPSIYLAIDSYEKLDNCGSEIVLQVKRK